MNQYPQPGLRVQCIVQHGPCHPVLTESCHHQKPTEGSREGHSNGQEIAHQHKTANNITILTEEK